MHGVEATRSSEQHRCDGSLTAEVGQRGLRSDGVWTDGLRHTSLAVARCESPNGATSELAVTGGPPTKADAISRRHDISLQYLLAILREARKGAEIEVL